MANNCYFLIRPVARNPESIWTLFKIMSYTHPDGIYVYRVREIEMDEKPRQFGRFWAAQFSGDVAWSDYYWFHDYFAEHDDLMRRCEIPESALHKEPDDKEMRANIRMFYELCRGLDLGVEIWTEELGCEFQGHKICTADGDLIVDETRPYALPQDAEKIPGYEGFGSLWGEWSEPEEIYGRELPMPEPIAVVAEDKKGDKDKVKGTFSKTDQEKNAKLLVDMTGRGLGMSAKAFKELPELKYAGGSIERLKKALAYVTDHLTFPVEMPAFDPSVCQTLMTDKNALETYDEFPEGGNQLLFAGGPGGTIWMCVKSDFPVGVLKEPFSVVGHTSDGRIVIRQSYIKFLRQFLPETED